VIPVYLYEHINPSLQERFKSDYSTDLLYRTNSGIEYYGNLLVTDMTSPSFLPGSHRPAPRRFGWTLGTYLPKVLPGPHTSTLRAEYTFVDRLTYTATFPNHPELAYVYDSQVIGSPFGPNSNGFYLRGEQYFTDKLSLILEYLNNRQTNTGDPEVGNTRFLSAQLAYDINPRTSVSFRIEPFKNDLPQGGTQKGTLNEVRATYAF
jgi:hypothetical protein